MLVKCYKGENILSGGTACKWYINEEIAQIGTYFDRVYDHHEKIQWISAGEQQFRSLEMQKNMEEKTVCQLRDIDPWEFENCGYRCTVTISRINTNQPWWFSSCTKCHRSSVAQGSQYRCSGGCPCTTAEPKYRLCLIGTDGTGTAEFVLFGRAARQIVGKPVVALIRSANKNQPGSAESTDHILPELAAIVSQKFTFSVSVTQKSLTQRNVSFQVNSVVASYGKQACIPISADVPTSSTVHVDPTETSNPTAQNDGSEMAPKKKARINHMISIPCKKKLDLQSSKHVSDEEQGNPNKQDQQQILEDQRIVQTASVDGPKETDQSGGQVHISTGVVPNRDADKSASSSETAAKQKQISGRKKN
ncbi:unnamed protein product [Urochloa humidicola]